MHDERHARSSTTSRAQTPNNVPNAALTAALIASRKPSYATLTCAGSGYNVALTKPHNGARSTAQSVHRTAAPALTPAYTGSSTTSTSYFGLERNHTGRDKELTPTWSSAASSSASPAPSPLARPGGDSRSASFAAATLAASRHRQSTPSRTPSYEPAGPDSRALALQRRLDEQKFARSLSDSMDNGNDRPDMTSIDSTRSLVHLFEQQTGSAAASTRTTARQPSLAKGKPPPIVAPKPQRTLSVQSVAPELGRTIAPGKPKPLIPARALQNNGDISVAKRPAASIIEQNKPMEVQKPIIPTPRRSAKRPMVNTREYETSSAPPPVMGRFGLPIPSTNKSPPRNQVPATSRITPSNDRRAFPAPYKDQSLNMISPHVTGDSLANAIVGANLAMRSPSPHKRARTPPPLPGPRRRGHHYGMDILQPGRARSLSPTKKQPGKLLSTLRGEEAEDKMKIKKHHFRQPNKHHEGTRERWRDFVSDSERKRYEGVWAANKGHYHDVPDEVLNLIVKDIWSRSRLPSEKLGRIWDLVAVDDDSDDEGTSPPRKRRSLTRDQFVVGMWLIDQVLKGRNLPHSVHASVWTSVRLMGVKVRLEGKGKDGRKLERGTAW